MRIAISGSYRRHLDAIDSVSRTLRELGADVLTRVGRPAVDDLGFIRFEGQETASIRELEEEHLRCIDNADVLLIVCPDGMIGLSTAFEIGYAFARSKPVVTHDMLSDPMTRVFVSHVDVFSWFTTV